MEEQWQFLSTSLKVPHSFTVCLQRHAG